MVDLTNQVVIVTGAAGNLGSAVAAAFDATGAKIVLVDHQSSRLHAFFPTMQDQKRYYLAEGVDVSREDMVNRMVAETMTRFGQIDILVNAIGGYRGGKPVHETSLDTWDTMFNLNARSVFITCRAVIPHMLARKSGKIINVSSRAALSGSAESSAYSASKSAIVRLTESISAELRDAGINVNCVLPGVIDTPQNRAAMPKANFAKWVAPAAIADVIVFLSSNAARAVHAAAIPV
ncbi:MAG: SDR family NAD(P)-dependent oxidoreductase [Chloroflexi bacterium]|nr:SDR family NAD(P)-dependent oxidoreductase [Chloroflexota bacterium]